MENIEKKFRAIKDQLMWSRVPDEKIKGWEAIFKEKKGLKIFWTVEIRAFRLKTQLQSRKNKNNIKKMMIQHSKVAKHGQRKT